MDIRLILDEEGIGINGHLHNAKSITLLCDYGCDCLLVENVDGSFERYKVGDQNGIIRIEDINK